MQNDTDDTVAILTRYNTSMPNEWAADIAQLEPIEIGLVNPEWDLSQSYVPRLERPEWISVGLLGKLYLYDNGNCTVGGYCRCCDPSDPGVGTSTISSTEGYRVMERISSTVVRVLLK